MICSLTGEVASEKVSKARKLFDKLRLFRGSLSVMAKACLIAKSTDCARIKSLRNFSYSVLVGHNEPVVLRGKSY